MGKGEIMNEEQQACADLNCSITGKSINEAIIGIFFLISFSLNFP